MHYRIPAKDGDLRVNRWPMAERWIAEIRYAGYPSSTVIFEDFTNLGALVEMDAHRDAITDITITPNRPTREIAVPNFFKR